MVILGHGTRLFLFSVTGGSSCLTPTYLVCLRGCVRRSKFDSELSFPFPYTVLLIFLSFFLRATRLEIRYCNFDFEKSSIIFWLL